MGCRASHLLLASDPPSQTYEQCGKGRRSPKRKEKRLSAYSSQELYLVFPFAHFSHGALLLFASRALLLLLLLPPEPGLAGGVELQEERHPCGTEGGGGGGEGVG